MKKRLYNPEYGPTMPATMEGLALWWGRMLLAGLHRNAWYNLDQSPRQRPSKSKRARLKGG